MMTPAADDNGRVTSAVLGAKLDRVIEDINRLDGTLQKLVSCISDHSVTLGRHDEQLETCHKEIEKLRTVNTIWSSLNSLAATVAAALGVRPG